MFLVPAPVAGTHVRQDGVALADDSESSLRDFLRDSQVVDLPPKPIQSPDHLVLDYMISCISGQMVVGLLRDSVA